MITTHRFAAVRQISNEWHHLYRTEVDFKALFPCIHQTNAPAISRDVISIRDTSGALVGSTQPTLECRLNMKLILAPAMGCGFLKVTNETDV